MLQSIRDKAQGWITSTVIGLLIVIFALVKAVKLKIYLF